METLVFVAALSHEIVRPRANDGTELVWNRDFCQAELDFFDYYDKTNLALRHAAKRQICFPTYLRKPLMICSSASCSLRPSVMSLINWSPAILPMAAS